MNTQAPSLTRLSALPPATAGQSILSRLFDELDAAMDKARLRSDLRRRLRVDANIRRDLGVTRFEMLRMTDRP